MGLKMSNQNLTKLTPEAAREVPMVDLAFAVLKNDNNPMYYRDLMKEIAKIKGLSDDEVMQVIAQVYTEINIDGRFACVGNNLWGLKRWYPVERTEDAMGGGKHPRIINDEDDDDLDDEALFADEADDYAADGDDFDATDDAEDPFEADAEEVEDEAEEEIVEEIEDDDLGDDDLVDELDEEEEVDDELDEFGEDEEDDN
jgi:DNA-directed RNA polymerase subunit delta